MPLNVYWHDDKKKILRSDAVGQWTWEEYDAMVDRAAAMIREVSHDVGIISDISRSERMPKGSPMQHLRYTKSVLPPNVKAMITVGKYSLFASAIISAFLKVYSSKNIKMQVAASEAEALKLLETDSVA